MDLYNTARKIIRETPCNTLNFERDSHAYFKPINETWGVKFFLDLSMRNKTYDLQEYANRHGLAPRIRDKFTAKTFDGGQVHGYVTEVVPKTEMVRYLNDDKAHGTWDQWKRWEAQCDEVHVLKYHLQKIGMTTKDLHWRNVGFLNGKMVCFDFSEENMTD